MGRLSEGAEAVRAYLEAEDIAMRVGHEISSAHLLLALFTFPNPAQALLMERKIDEDAVLEQFRVLDSDVPHVIRRIRDRAREIARSSSSSEIGCLHVLIAITRMKECLAYTLLSQAGLSITALRNLAIRFVTGTMPRRLRRPVATEPGEGPLLRPSARSKPSQSQEVRPRARHTEAPPTARVAPVPEPPPEAAASETPSPPRLAPARPGSLGRPVGARGALSARLAEMAPALTGCGWDMTAAAREGKLDRVIGRDSELQALVDVLGKRRANNPVLVGPPGVGKTAIVEGLAVKAVRQDDDVRCLTGRIIFALDTGALVAGTSLRGAFSERLGAIREEVARAQGQIVVFVDELHTLIGAGTSGDGPQDAANELKAALARGEFPCIGATTDEEYTKHIEKDGALERRFSPITVSEPALDEAILILEGGITPYAEHHGINYTLDAVHAAVQLSHRFVPERKLPDKCFAVVDLAGSRARRRGANRVERRDIAQVIHEWSGVPLERLIDADSDRLNRAEALVSEKLVGHAEVVAATCQALRRGFAGFHGHRPIGSFLYLGPTGVGKTELVRILAEFLFGRRDAVVRLDMSELSEAHSVARLIGAQPGYVGYEEGGQLTEALRKRPFQIVLFDEIEKAHANVHNLLLQILDEGHLTDARGRRVSFANTVVVLTSNLGANAAAAKGSAIGFGTAGSSSMAKGQAAVLQAARGRLAPELWGRLDERLVFSALTRAEVRQIANLQLNESSRHLFAEREITLTWEDAICDFLLEHGGFSPETGARGMRHAIQRHVEGPLAAQILAGEFSRGDSVHASLDPQHTLTFSLNP